MLSCRWTFTASQTFQSRTSIEMDTLQVENLLRADCKLSTIFDGVFASDCLPMFCGGGDTGLVMNLDPSSQSGSHWVSIYIQNGRGEYFDSYGMAPPLEEFLSFLKRNSTSWSYNKQELQSLDSMVCGHYCIWFLSERARGRSMQNIVQQFSNTDTRWNDNAVKQQVETRFGAIVERIESSASSSRGRSVQCCWARKR
jgi:hypothetical protein